MCVPEDTHVSLTETRRSEEVKDLRMDLTACQIVYVNKLTLKTYLFGLKLEQKLWKLKKKPIVPLKNCATKKYSVLAYTSSCQSDLFGKGKRLTVYYIVLAVVLSVAWNF